MIGDAVPAGCRSGGWGGDPIPERAHNLARQRYAVNMVLGLFFKKSSAAILDRVRNYPYLRPKGISGAKPVASVRADDFEEVSTLTDKGQTTVPKSVRRALGLSAGD